MSTSDIEPTRIKQTQRK